MYLRVSELRKGLIARNPPTKDKIISIEVYMSTASLAPGNVFIKEVSFLFVCAIPAIQLFCLLLSDNYLDDIMF